MLCKYDILPLVIKRYQSKLSICIVSDGKTARMSGVE